LIIHSLALLSALAEAKYFPSAEKFTQLIEALCASSVASSLR
jgi:hypothetical protein